ncbi:MAG: hypothetical protein PVF18_00060 [Anaerolineales bacterium]|jgi:hypothetical protein
MGNKSINTKKFSVIISINLTFLAACGTALDVADTPQPVVPSETAANPTATDEALRDLFEGADLAITGLDGNILLADVESDEVFRLTEDALPDPLPEETFITYGEPTWSPVDERLAFIRTVRSSGEGLDVDILVTGRDFKTVEIEADGEQPFYLYWSPDGNRLSFLASRPGETISLWVKDLQDEGDRLDQGQPYFWDWAPDGSRLMAHVGGSITLNPDGAYLSFFGTDRIELELPPLSFQAPAYSPNGEQILVASRSVVDGDSLLMLGPEGDILQEIVPVEGRTSFAWSPDGSNFAVVNGPDLGSVHIGVLSLFSVNQEELAEPTQNIGEDVIAFWWSPDGSKLAYFVPVLSPSDLTQPISMNAQDDNELFLQLYVYDLESDTSRRLSSFRPTEEFLRIMPYFDQYQRSSTIWSADSQEIAYASLGENGFGQIFVVAVDGGGIPRRIAPGQIAYWRN